MLRLRSENFPSGLDRGGSAYKIYLFTGVYRENSIWNEMMWLSAWDISHKSYLHDFESI